MDLRPLEPEDAPLLGALCDRHDVAPDIDLDRPRLRHVGRVWLAAPAHAEVAARRLLEAASALASDWWQLERVEISLPAPSGLHAAGPSTFQREVVRRRDFERDGALVDAWEYASVRRAAPEPPVRAFARRPREPLPASFELRPVTLDDAAGFVRMLMDAGVLWATLQAPFAPVGRWRQRFDDNDLAKNKLFVAIADGRWSGARASTGWPASAGAAGCSASWSRPRSRAAASARS